MKHQPQPLSQLLDELTPAHAADVSIRGDVSICVTGLTLSSQSAQGGKLFIALPGAISDGRDYFLQAQARGAHAIAAEAEALTPAQQQVLEQLNICLVLVVGLRHKLGLIAARFYGFPSRSLKLIGVTGTNGKTSVVQMCADIVRRLDGQCGQMGTLGNGLAGELTPTLNTTSDPITIQRTLAQIRDAGAGCAVMEVSSHALTQGRVVGVDFAVCVFTNLTRDHLDYHADMVEYGEAKATLLVQTQPTCCVINRDDPFGRELIQRCAGECVVVDFGLAVPAVEAAPTGSVLAQESVSISDLKTLEYGQQGQLLTPWGVAQLNLPMMGVFNLSNALAVVAILGALKYDLTQVVKALATVCPVPGRMECFGGGDKPLVVVDYAHTPDALEKALAALRPHCHGRLWCIFGCGGDRDPGKRSMMARAAEQGADQLLITDDNPRQEDGNRIVSDILSGLEHPERALVERDRARAVKLAVDRSGKNDSILLAGKGHESYQLVCGSKLRFSDRDLAQDLVGECRSCA